VHFSACALTSSDEEYSVNDYYSVANSTSNTVSAIAVSGSSSGAAAGSSSSSRRRSRATAAREKCKDTVGKLQLPLYTTK
jgi:hypothetical protein